MIDGDENRKKRKIENMELERERERGSKRGSKSPSYGTIRTGRIRAVFLRRVLLKNVSPAQGRD